MPNYLNLDAIVDCVGSGDELPERLEIQYIPKQGSWLARAETELSV